MAMPSDDLEHSEDAKDNDEENSKASVFEAKFTLHNVFHLDQIILSEKIFDTRVIISIDCHGKIILRDLISAKYINYYNLNVDITAAYLKNKRLYIGTATGSFRIFEFNDDNEIKEVYNIKLSKTKEIKKLFSSDSILFIILNKRIVLYNCLDFDHNYYGFINTTKSIIDFTAKETMGGLKLLLLFDPGIIVEYKINKSSLLCSKEITKMNDREYEVVASKVDLDLTHVTYDKNGEFIYSIGKDLYLRKYNLPKELLINLEQRVNFPAIPLEEVQIINDEATNLFVKNSCIIASTLNGDVIEYNLDTKSIYSFNIGCSEFNGISYITNNINGNDYAVGTFNGCIIFKNINIEILNDIEYPVSKYQTEKCLFTSESDIEYYEDIILRERRLKEKQKRQDIEADIMSELSVLKKEYKKLLELNESVDPQKKISFDEFCIDIKEKETIEQNGKKEIDKIYFKADRYTSHNDLIHAKIKEHTFDKMEDHLKTITGLQENIIVYNFCQPKTSLDEVKSLNKIKLLRKLELRENKWRKDNGLPSSIDIEDVVTKQSNFVVNGVPGRPQLILIDYQARDAELREYREEQRKKKEELINMQNGLNIKKKKFEIKNRERKRKRGTFLNTTKNTINTGSTQNNRTISIMPGVKEMDEESWLIMYSSIELFSRFKKVNQILFIKNIIRLIKQEFNSQFNHMMKVRNKKKDVLYENFKKIDEINKELEIVETLIEPKINIIER